MGDTVVTTVDSVGRSLEQAWGRDTSADPDLWSEDNPSWGQCAVTALVVQDMFGGDLLRGMLGEVSHYWNRLADGTVLDFTRQQFQEEEVNPTDVGIRDRDYVLSYPPTVVRYEILAGRMRGAR